MKDYIYQNKRNDNKFIEVRRYADGHYVWKQYITRYISTSFLGVNYVGCSFKRVHIGTWHRVSKRTLEEVLADYSRVA